MCGILATAGVARSFHHRLLNSLRKRGPDEFGIKPLYYWLSGTRLCVGSTLRAILDVVKDTQPLDYEALSEYARYQFTFGDKTFLKTVKKILPGHVVEIDLETGSLRDEV